MKNQDIHKRIKELLKELRLPTVREAYEEAAQKAKQENMDYAEYLLELLEDEAGVRRQKRLERWLKISNLPLDKSFETFDMKRLPMKLAYKVKSLRDGSFLDRKENVLAFGNPGSGKTHLLCAIGHELLQKDRRVLCYKCNLLVEEMLRAKKDLKLERLLKKLSKFEALILDDIGYVQQSRDEMEVLFTLLSHRYERGSVLITSNLKFSQWEKIFKDPMTTAAAIDRLVHHSVILEMNVPSFRMEQAKKKKK